MGDQKALEQIKHIIVFHDKSTLEITGVQQEALLEASTSGKFIKVSGHIINFASISKILTLGEYYKEYPDKIPDQRNIFKRETYKELSIRELWEKDVKRAKGIKKGLLRSIREKDTPKKQELLKQVEETIKDLT